jgi:hypothetical protein
MKHVQIAFDIHKALERGKTKKKALPPRKNKKKGSQKRSEPLRALVASTENRKMQEYGVQMVKVKTEHRIH